MLPFPDQQIARGCIAADSLEGEIRRLIRVWRKLDTILREKQPLTSTQRDVLDDLILTVDVYMRVLEGDWAVPDHLHQHSKGKKS